MNGLEICFRISVQGLRRSLLINKKTIRNVEEREEMTDGLNVSNNSEENIISQGRFECFAYNLEKFKDETRVRGRKSITMSISKRTFPFDKVVIITCFLRANRPCALSGQPML